MRLATLAAAATAVMLTGCATPRPANLVTLTFTSKPAGAYITPTGEANGELGTYVTRWTTAELQNFKDSKGCFKVKGMSARWGSGATARSPDVLLLCEGAGDYNWVLNRDPAHPNLHLDLDFALRYTGQQQQQQAANEAREQARADAIVEGLAGAMNAYSAGRQQAQPVQIAPMRCTSKRSISGTVTTDCN